jgi:hypothetical protein
VKLTQICLAAAAALTLSVAAVPVAMAATVFDAVEDFHAPGSLWSYGYGTAGVPGSFTAFTVNGPCLTAGLDCAAPPPALQTDGTPVVAKNTTGALLSYASTVAQPEDVLNVHPGEFVDTFVRFTAATGGKYYLSGFWQILDNNPNRGVSISISGGDLPFAPVPLTGALAKYGESGGGKTPFSGYVTLTPGQYLDFVVNNAGPGTAGKPHYYDSTGLAATLTLATVPEPATWGLMIVGFGGAGAVFRSRRRIFSA